MFTFKPNQVLPNQNLTMCLFQAQLVETKANLAQFQWNCQLELSLAILFAWKSQGTFFTMWEVLNKYFATTKHRSSFICTYPPTSLLVCSFVCMSLSPLQIHLFIIPISIYQYLIILLSFDYIILTIHYSITLIPQYFKTFFFKSYLMFNYLKKNYINLL